MFSLIILGLVASVSASAHVYHNGQCPLVKPVENFNLEAYGNGVWYEIARYPNDAEQGGQCGSTEYSLQGDTIQIKSYHVSSGRLASIEGGGRLALPSTSEGKMIFTLPYGDFAWILSRTKTLDARTKAKVDKFMRESQFLDAGKFIYNDFSESACRSYNRVLRFSPT